MTLKERVISLLGFAPSNNDNAIDGALIDAGYTGDETYSSAYSEVARAIALQVVPVLLTTPDQTNMITGESTKFDRAAIEARIRGDVDGARPVIRGVKVW